MNFSKTLSSFSSINILNDLVISSPLKQFKVVKHCLQARELFHSYFQSSFSSINILNDLLISSPLKQFKVVKHCLQARELFHSYFQRRQPILLFLLFVACFFYYACLLLSIMDIKITLRRYGQM